MTSFRTVELDIYGTSDDWAVSDRDDDVILGYRHQYSSTTSVTHLVEWGLDGRIIRQVRVPFERRPGSENRIYSADSAG